MITIGKVGTHDLTLDATKLAILLGVIAIVPAILTVVVNVLLQPAFEKNKTQLEKDKLEFEKRKSDAAFYRAVLANADPVKRQALLKFLISAKLVDDRANVGAVLPGAIPNWPAVAGVAP